MSALEGGCSCGAVRYRLTSKPMFVHCCHCLNCQRQTGSAFVINLLIESDRLDVSGEPQAVDVPRDDGSTHRIYRCPKCQIAVFSEYGAPAVKFVRAGTLDHPSAVAPDVHLHALEGAMGGASGRRAGGRGLLRPARAVAGREPRTAGRRLQQLTEVAGLA